MRYKIQDNGFAVIFGLVKMSPQNCCLVFYKYILSLQDVVFRSIAFSYISLNCLLVKVFVRYLATVQKFSLKVSASNNFNFFRVVDGYAIFHWWQKYTPENSGKL